MTTTTTTPAPTYPGVAPEQECCFLAFRARANRASPHGTVAVARVLARVAGKGCECPSCGGYYYPTRAAVAALDAHFGL